MAYVGIQRQSVTPALAVLANNNNIDFNTNIPLVNANTDITYATNTFTFIRSGFYLVEWFVVLQSAFSTGGPVFTLVSTTPGTPGNVVNYPSSSSFKTGIISGSAIVEASANTTLVLKNTTGGEVILANNVDVVANISITRVVQELQGIELELTDSGGQTISTGDPVAYNVISSDQSSEITNLSGVIGVSLSGVYAFDWIVSVAGNKGDIREIKFELKIITSSGIRTVGTSVWPAVTQGAIVGSAIAAASAGDAFYLVNASAADLMYDDISVQSFMRIISIV